MRRQRRAGELEGDEPLGPIRADPRESRTLMRALHVVPTYLPAVRYGGPIYSVHELCRALAARGHDVHVFTTDVDGSGCSAVPLGSPVDRDGVQITYFPSTRLRRIYWSPPMGKALCGAIPEFDVLHLHSVFLWPTSAAAAGARRHRRPYVLAPRGMLVRDLIRRKSRLVKSAWLSLFEKRNLLKAGLIHATSTVEVEDLNHFGWRLPTVAVVPNGVDPTRLEAAEDAIDETVMKAVREPGYILFLGRISWKKGLDRLMRAVSRVDNVKLVISGPDDENYMDVLRRLGSELGVSSRVVYTGAVAGATKCWLLKSARFLSLPSYSENFGNVVAEAMGVGCPVVVTPEVGISRDVESFDAGIVVPGDPEALAAQFKRLLADPPLCLRMGENGRRLVEARYTWSAIAQEMERWYERIVAEGSLP